MEVTPYRMTPDVIRSVVQKHRPGVYILGDDAVSYTHLTLPTT